jgi:hypothetical protein
MSQPIDGRAAGYIDCGTFDRATVYGGEGSDGSIITDSIEMAAASIAFAVDPALRRRGAGRVMIAALLARPELAFVSCSRPASSPTTSRAAAASRRPGSACAHPSPTTRGCSIRPLLVGNLNGGSTARSAPAALSFQAAPPGGCPGLQENTGSVQTGIDQRAVWRRAPGSTRRPISVSPNQRSPNTAEGLSHSP